MESPAPGTQVVERKEAISPVILCLTLGFPRSGPQDKDLSASSLCEGEGKRQEGVGRGDHEEKAPAEGELSSQLTRRALRVSFCSAARGVSAARPS